MLARIGAAVRERLADNPAVQRFPEDRAEVYAVDGFLGAEECARLVGQIDAVACPSGLIDEEHWPDYRTSYSGDIDVHDTTVRTLEDRLAALTGIPPACGESAQGQRYRCGQYFREHCDWFDTNAGYWQHERRCGGQRSWTAMIYLNCVDEGGATEFTRVHLSVPPLTGCLLLWNNALPDGTPNPWTMHAARPVVRGVKYVVTKWYRVRSWQ
ncbi:2OG-Fe(II) oxygenase [Novosphingobium mangrovi (ex Huang et al. 2023)]|uniref:2OG-Fe(II) oxygenase n=1 Tax=Novosphingobium mangrovi (ex Huang et al. 2023) TaxID=2976432 RepID=A0ABT2I3T4_9SPHN|nr:2OG-Fe(II) oxygenase [Novosphingobium mangrovi (ex Huang et al. 2023)]MCT2399466.1 2OG-Fe(II) oxygenase [Novosphingobium mangrovi (ex Huang et al. 2023)]